MGVLVATIVVLNGTSSSGKTTLARAFQESAPSLFLNFSIDSVLYALPPSVIERMIAGAPNPNVGFDDLVAGYYACVRELAAHGYDLIIDNAITSRVHAEQLVRAVDGHSVLMVLVSCPEDILRERERARGDRRPGLASKQIGDIARWLEYDLKIDTSLVSPEAGARRILEMLRTVYSAPNGSAG